MAYNNSYANDPNTQIPYDLRQIYAINLVGDHLQDIARARKADDYPNYFKSLKDLWIITQHKIKVKDKEAPEKYNELLKNTYNIINKHPACFSKRGGNANGKAMIEYYLNEIEKFLYDKLDEAQLFGTKWDDEGL